MYVFNHVEAMGRHKYEPVACQSSQVKCNFFRTVILCTLFMATKFEFESHESIFGENDSLEPLVVLVEFLSEISGVQTPKTPPPVTPWVRPIHSH